MEFLDLGLYDGALYNPFRPSPLLFMVILVAYSAAKMGSWLWRQSVLPVCQWHMWRRELTEVLQGIIIPSLCSSEPYVSNWHYSLKHSCSRVCDVAPHISLSRNKLIFFCGICGLVRLKESFSFRLFLLSILWWTFWTWPVNQTPLPWTKWPAPLRASVPSLGKRWAVLVAVDWGCWCFSVG